MQAACKLGIKYSTAKTMLKGYRAQPFQLDSTLAINETTESKLRYPN